MRRPAVVLPTGAGKTVVFAHVAAQMRERGVRTMILAHRDELIEQAAAKVRAVAPDLRVGIVKGPRREIRGRDVVVASVQSLARPARRAEIAAAGLRLVIVDECFPAGTAVGSVPIEQLRVGDLVPSWDEATGAVVERPVAAVMSSRPVAMVRVTFEDGTSLACTPNHPLMTAAGWCPASRLLRGASVLMFTHDAVNGTNDMLPLWSGADDLGSPACELAPIGQGVLRAGLRASDAEASWRGATAEHRDALHRLSSTGDGYREGQDHGVASVRSGVLLGRVPGPLGKSGQLAEGVSDESTARVTAHAGEQPNGAPGVRQEDEGDAQAHRTQAPPATRQWVGAGRSAATPSDLSGVADGGHCPRARWAETGEVHGGHCPPVDDGVRRGGRGIPYAAGPPGIGSSPGRTARRARVADVQVLEPGGDGTYGGVCPDGLVYNLEVETTHTYLVGRGIVAHNCHHAVANTYVETLKAMGCFDDDLERGAYALGVTATMGRSDRVALGQVWQDVVYRRDIVEMIRAGHLVNAKGVRVRVEGLDLAAVKRRAGDFADGALAEAMHASLAPAAIARAYVEHAKDRAGVLFAPGVAMAYEMAEALTAEGVEARGIDGAMAMVDRRKVLADYARGDVQVICNAMVLTEGWDAPWCSAAVIARPTSSASLYVQMAGRALRPHPGKSDALIMDVVGVTGRHRLASIADLGGADRVEQLDADLAQYEPDDEVDLLGLLDAEPSGGGGFPDAPGADGPLVAEIVDLFGASRRAWLQTPRGVWFLQAGDDLVFIAPEDQPGRYAVARCPLRAAGGEFLHRDVDLDMAMSWGEHHASEAKELTRRSAAWRRGEPSGAQLGMAAQLGVIVPANATKGEVSDAISAAVAAGRIDPMPCVATVSERGYW